MSAHSSDEKRVKYKKNKLILVLPLQRLKMLLIFSISNYFMFCIKQHLYIFIGDEIK